MEKEKKNLLEKLKKKGFDTEKKVCAIDLQIAVDQGFTMAEAGLILKLQKAIKGHNLYSFLMDGTDEKPEGKEAKHAECDRNE